MRVKLEQLQRPKDEGGLALPNYLVAQFQHIVRAMPLESAVEGDSVDPTTNLLLYVMGVDIVAMGLEVLAFSKSNKLFPTYVLIQKNWNEVKQMQDVADFTRFSPIGGNGNYSDLKSLQYGAKLKFYGIAHMFQFCQW